MLMFVAVEPATQRIIKALEERYRQLRLLCSLTTMSVWVAPKTGGDNYATNVYQVSGTLGVAI